jgi:hypothetical protein
VVVRVPSASNLGRLDLAPRGEQTFDVWGERFLAVGQRAPRVAVPLTVPMRVAPQQPLKNTLQSDDPEEGFHPDLVTPVEHVDELHNGVEEGVHARDQKVSPFATPRDLPEHMTALPPPIHVDGSDLDARKASLNSDPFNEIHFFHSEAINRRSPRYLAWLCVVCVLSVYSVVKTGYSLSFPVGAHAAFQPAFALDWLIDLAFVAHVVVQLRLSYVRTLMPAPLAHQTRTHTHT